MSESQEHKDVEAPEEGQGVSRRHFLGRLAKASVAVAAAGGVSYALYDPKGPGPVTEPVEKIVLGDYSVASAGKRMAIAHGTEREKMLGEALKALGGIETFIKKGDKVLLKVNAAFASPPILSATTHPSVIREMIKLCLKAGASEVRVTDNPINDPQNCFRLSGIAEAVESAGGKLYLPKASFFRPYTLEKATLIRDWPLLYTPIKGVDKVIGIAPCKDHQRAGASMTMKNWYGLLGGRRNVFHQDINTIITELAQLVRPTLVILDGTTSMMSNGPTGGATSDLKATQTLIISTDPVAADTCGAKLLERSLSDLAYIQKAEAAGVGTTNFESLKPAVIQTKA